MSSLFLFGAGASAFAGPERALLPPTGPELFGRLRELKGVAASLAPELAAALGADFEAGMAALLERDELSVPALYREIARYLVTFDAVAPNAYLELVAGLKKSGRGIVFSSLNYDLVLEKALSSVGIGVAYRLIPQSPDGVSVLKLHGSCNFLPDMVGTFKNVRFKGVGTYVDGPIRIGSAEETLKFCRTEDSLAPAVALYMKGKRVPFCPQFVKDVNADWKRTLKAVHRIFIIGVHLNLEDEHLWGPIAKARVPVWYVGPEGSDFCSWARSERMRAWHLDDDFPHSVTKMLRKLG